MWIKIRIVSHYFHETNAVSSQCTYSVYAAPLSSDIKGRFPVPQLLHSFVSADGQRCNDFQPT